MKEPKTFEDFDQLPAHKQARWIDSISQETVGHWGGAFADAKIDLVVLFERDKAGGVKIIRHGRLTDIRKKKPVCVPSCHPSMWPSMN